MSKSVLCHATSQSNQNPTNTSGPQRRSTKRSSQVGRTHQKTTRSGQTWFMSGRSIAFSDMAGKKWSSGIGKFGMKQTFLTGAGHLKIFANYTITLLMLCEELYQQLELADLTRPVLVDNSC